MAQITTLIEGYVQNEGQSVQATVTLVQDNGHNILVDPGMTQSPLAITRALQEHGLTPDDIDTVFITHHHPDHTRYVGLFIGARLYDYASMYASDRWLNAEDYPITPDVKIIQTPGHTPEDATLLVTNVTNIPEKSPCTVAICHLWWYEGKDDDPTADNRIQLQESRAKILALTDFIVPGHGKMFRVPR